MSTIVEASVPAAQFALQETSQRVPDAVFEAVRIVTDRTDGTMPLLWSSGAEAEAITAALESDTSTDDIRILAQFHETTLYQLDWTTRVEIVTHLLVPDRGVILRAQARSGRWTFRILFPRRETVATIVEECDRYDINLKIERIHPMTESRDDTRSHLTEEQFQTIEAALENGYYDVPRETTLTELAEELDVSHQALSERLRRGHRRLVETALGSRLRFESQL